MVVYIDILLIINTVLNYAVLVTAEKLLKRDIRLLRLLAGSFTGALFSLIVFLDINNTFLLFVIRLVSSALITLISFGFHKRSEYIKAVTMTCAVSLLYCGGMILFYQAFKPSNMLIINDVIYFELDPLLMILITAIIYVLLLILYKLFSERIKSTVVSMRFTVGGKEYSCVGKIDTGCNLTEPFSGSPVIIADKSIFPDNGYDKQRIIPYTAVSGSSFLRAVKAEKVVIDKKTIDTTVYIASADIKSSSFAAIINSDIIR